VTAAKQAAMPSISAAERQARAVAIQKRTLTLPPSSLPGIGPNARPLPSGLQPKAGVSFPKGVTPLNPPLAGAKSESSPASSAPPREPAPGER
jgi:hypothetical protein